DAEGNIIKEAKTDALGNYQFKKLAFGEYTVQVTNESETKTANVTVEAVDGYCVVPEIAFGEKPVVNKAVLEVVTDIYSTYDESEYTEESWAVFAQAVKDAKEILEDEAATQEEVDAALETLKNAASGLAKVEIPVPVNKNAIKVVVGIYKTYDETEYTKEDRKSTRLNSSHVSSSYAVFCLKKKK